MISTNHGVVQFNNLCTGQKFNSIKCVDVATNPYQMPFQGFWIQNNYLFIQ